MLENKGILDNPRIQKEEAALKTEPIKKKSRWLFKLILILIVIGIVYYFFKNPEGIRNWFNSFLDKLLK